MKSVLCFLTLLGFLTGCASDEAQMRKTLEKNPQIVFDIIEQHPTEFLEVVNRVAQKAQLEQAQKHMARLSEEREKDMKNPKKPPVTDAEILFGTAKAPIQLVEYADFQCPACGMAHESLKQFAEAHPGQIEFVFKSMPLEMHPMAYPSALYYEAVLHQDKVKARQFHDLIYENQRQLSEAFLKKTAKQVGANMAKVEADIKTAAIKDRVQADMKEFEGFGFEGTPVLILNGVSMYGAQPVEELEKVLAMTQKK